MKEIFKDFAELLKNETCHSCGGKLSYQPGYFLVGAGNAHDRENTIIYLAENIEDFLESDIINKKSWASDYDPKEMLYDFGSINYTNDKCINEWKMKYKTENDYVFENNIYNNNSLCYEFCLTHSKQIPTSLDVDENGERIVDNFPRIDFVFERKNLETERNDYHDSYYLSVDDCFGLLKYYRKAFADKELNKKIEAIEKKQGRLGNLTGYEVKEEINSDFLKRYFLKLINIEANIYSLTKRIPEINFAAEETERLLNGTNNIFNEQAELEKAEQELKSLEAEKTEDVDWKAICQKLEKEKYKAKAFPSAPQKPTEPIYEKPGLFNKKKINALNEQKKAEYEKALSDWEAATEEFNTKKAEIEAYNLEMKAKAEAEAKETAQAETEKLNADLEKRKAKAAEEVDKAKKTLAEKEAALANKEPNIFEEELKEATEMLKSLLDARNKLLSTNVIYDKYRNIVAYSTFYEYLMSGRCETLEGTNGAYNIYESEVRANIIISQLSNVLESLEQIKENQFKLYQQLEAVNSNLETLNDSMGKAIDVMQSVDNSVKNIADNSDVIAYNTERTAYYSKMNAELTDSLGYLTAFKL